MNEEASKEETSNLVPVNNEPGPDSEAHALDSAGGNTENEAGDEGLSVTVEASPTHGGAIHPDFVPYLQIIGNSDLSPEEKSFDVLSALMETNKAQIGLPKQNSMRDSMLNIAFQNEDVRVFINEIIQQIEVNIKSGEFENPDWIIRRNEVVNLFKGIKRGLIFLLDMVSRAVKEVFGQRESNLLLNQCNISPPVSRRKEEGLMHKYFSALNLSIERNAEILSNDIIHELYNEMLDSIEHTIKPGEEETETIQTSDEPEHLLSTSFNMKILKTYESIFQAVNYSSEYVHVKKEDTASESGQQGEDRKGAGEEVQSEEKRKHQGMLELIRDTKIIDAFLAKKSTLPHIESFIADVVESDTEKSQFPITKLYEQARESRQKMVDARWKMKPPGWLKGLLESKSEAEKRKELVNQIKQLEKNYASYKTWISWHVVGILATIEATILDQWQDAIKYKLKERQEFDEVRKGVLNTETFVEFFRKIVLNKVERRLENRFLRFMVDIRNERLVKQFDETNYSIGKTDEGIIIHLSLYLKRDVSYVRSQRRYIEINPDLYEVISEFPSIVRIMDAYLRSIVKIKSKMKKLVAQLEAENKRTDDRVSISVNKDRIEVIKTKMDSVDQMSQQLMNDMKLWKSVGRMIHVDFVLRNAMIENQDFLNLVRRLKNDEYFFSFMKYLCVNKDPNLNTINERLKQELLADTDLLTMILAVYQANDAMGERLIERFRRDPRLFDDILETKSDREKVRVFIGRLAQMAGDPPQETPAENEVEKYPDQTS